MQIVKVWEDKKKINFEKMDTDFKYENQKQKTYQFVSSFGHKI